MRFLLKLGWLLAAAATILAGCKKTAAPDRLSRAAVPGSTSISFQDVTGPAGLAFRWEPRAARPLTILHEMGCGCAFLDADNDGRLDVLLVGEGTPALYLNQGNGVFRDATHSSGLDRVRGFWKGVAVGDADGDGYLDLLLTGYNTLAFLKGGPGPTFRDYTRESGLKPQGWSTSAGFMDLTGDGTLDLVVGSYVRYTAASPQHCRMGQGVESGCPPNSYPPQLPHLYRNDGHAHFTDVTAASGMRAAHGKMLVLGFADFDGDGRTDFYLGNDGMYADLMRNRGGRRFENVAMRQGVALNVRQAAAAAMGVDWGDYDRDGRPDFVVTDFADQPFSLFHNQGGFFENASTAVGLAGPTTKPLGFGTKWVDVDNDGWPDLVFAEGQVYDNVHDFDPSQTYAQSMQLFRNEGGKLFSDISRSAGPAFSQPLVARGLASGDFDGDGRVDLLVVNHEGPPVLLRNTSSGTGNWLELELRGRGRNRFAYGAEVRVRAGEDRWWGVVSPASSYLSSSSPWLHFGLGGHARVDEIEVRWPDGRKERFTCDRVNQIGLVVEGEGHVQERGAAGVRG